jgi:RimJ/RimL family protein N-acetyltransferase
LGRLLIGEKDIVKKAPVFFEAELLLCDHAFDTLKMHKIHSKVMEDNKAMLNTRFYFGYTKEGVLREHYIYDGV